MLKMRLENNNERVAIINWCKDLGVDFNIDRFETFDMRTGLLEEIEEYIVFSSYNDGSVIVDLINERRAC